ncbi:hypothetical protein ACI2K4_14695 [Micromonospora sp. NPDC050397]|uniref:hypothetical protein n=1 Tax=Micromonospora sp. NPDC050397 TaxID=3364279 RepID=UPI00384CF242
MLLTVAMLANPAAADPSPATDYRMLAGTGSDTTQDVMNGLAEVITIGGNKVIASWDARGSANIKTKATGCDFARPNGSSAGRTALRNSETAGNAIAGCVDFARSSSGTANSPSGSGVWIPFGVDAVSFVINQNSDLPINMPVGQLRNIYRCIMGDIAGTPVQPLLLQAGSGTRQFWNQQMGITDQEIALGDYPCLLPPSQGGTGLDPVQEHDGRMLTGHNDYLLPFSIAQHIAQGNSLPGVEDRRGPSDLGSIGGASPYAAGSTPSNRTLNTNFPFRRDVYNIVPTADLSSSPLSQVFVGSGSLLCQQADVIRRYGFGFAANCGDTSLRANL